MNTVSSSFNFVFPSYNDIYSIEIIKFNIGGIDFHQNFAILWCLEVVGVEMWAVTPSTLQVTSQRLEEIAQTFPGKGNGKATNLVTWLTQSWCFSHPLLFLNSPQRLQTSLPLETLSEILRLSYKQQLGSSRSSLPSLSYS
jgi:hypothetical protein